MNKILKISLLFGSLISTNVFAQDTLYIHQKSGDLLKYATNSIDSITFYKATIHNSVKDYEGNVYRTVKIGTQTWMAENLRSEKYNDGTPINLETDTTKWYPNNTSKTPMMIWYKNDKNTNVANKSGALYNFYAIYPETNGNKNVCPVGWHVPTFTEWKQLVVSIGGSKTLDGLFAYKLKTTNGSWGSHKDIEEPTNEFGFSLLPAGYLHSTVYDPILDKSIAKFDTQMTAVSYLTSTINHNGSHMEGVENINFTNYAHFIGSYPMPFDLGQSLRCIKD